MNRKDTQNKAGQPKRPHNTIAYHVLKSAVEEALAAVRGPKVKALPKRDILMLQQTALLLVGHIALCTENRDAQGQQT